MKLTELQEQILNNAMVKQILKFGVVGVLASIIDFGTMIALHELLGIDVVISTAISFVVALTFNYLASMRFVFARRDDLSRTREATIFVVLSLIGLLINELIMIAGEAFFTAIGIPFQDGFWYVAVKIPPPSLWYGTSYPANAGLSRNRSQLLVDRQNIAEARNLNRL